MERLSVLILTFFIFSWPAGDLYAVSQYEVIKELQETEGQTMQAQKEAVEAIIRPKVEYQAQGLRDPFQDSLAKDDAIVRERKNEAVKPPPERPLPALTVQGIIWGGNFPQAIINNRVVREGDTLDEVRILKIEKDGIIVFFDAREHNLLSPAKISPEDIQQKNKRRQ